MKPDKIKDIELRLTQLEFAFAEYSRGGEGDRRLSDGDLAERYGLCARTVKRRRQKGLIPPVDEVEGDRPFTWLSTIQQHERQQAAASSKPGKPRKAAGTSRDAAVERA